MSTKQWDVALHGRLGDLELNLVFSTTAARVVVVGPNGAGKSSLLRALVGADLGLSGHVCVGGRTWQDAAHYTPPDQRRIGFVPQGCGLFTHLNVLGNVAFGCGGGQPAQQRAMHALIAVGAAHLATRATRELSGGERQRVALARAIAAEPTAILLDEPLAALDPVARIELRAMLHAQLRDRVAITVTHDDRDVAALGDWLLLVEDGRVVQQGPVDVVRAAPETPFGAAFFGVAS